MMNKTVPSLFALHTRKNSKHKHQCSRWWNIGWLFAVQWKM